MMEVKLGRAYLINCSLVTQMMESMYPREEYWIPDTCTVDNIEMMKYNLKYGILREYRYDK